jgi:two-component system, NarL family, sensor histidine kinase DesK
MGLLPKNREHGWAPYVWLIFMAFFFFQPVLDPHTTARDWIITGVASAAFLPIYFGVFWARPPLTYLLLIAMVAMGVGLANYNVGSSVFIIFAASFIPWVAGTSRRAMSALAFLILIIGIDAAVFHPQVGFWATSIVVALGVAGSNIHFAEKNRADTKLRMAHTEIEHLAKVAERERIARDLHDVLGHTLSLIIVKSTLAGKLIDKYPEKAKDEIADIEKASRDAMAEIRSTLRGYSTYKLIEEIQRAKSTLASAGIRAESDTTEVNMSPAQESVVALIMREAVTNVVRHSHARTCRLKLASENGSCVLSVEDDGRGGIQTEGNGLRGMRERIEALGGTVVRDTTAGTRLRFEFPLAASGNGTH